MRGKQKKLSAISCVEGLKPLVLDTLTRALQSKDRWERLKAAKIVSPYVFQELPMAIEHSGKVETTGEIKITIVNGNP